MRPRRGVALRLFVTCWLVYALHFATNVVREHYPAFSLAERGTLRVDPYLGLHPDLFALEGRGAFINNNPGASLLAAIPYALARPLVDAVDARVARARAGAPAPPPARYDDPRVNRRVFFERVRERGLDVRFGLAAGIIHLLCTAPLSAAAAVAMRAVLLQAGFGARAALAGALLYAFGTPVFFRSGHLSHNLLVAHAALFAFALLYRPREGAPKVAAPPRRLLAAGALLGGGVLCDYSGVIPLAALGLYVFLSRAAAAGPAPAARAAAWLAAGSLAPLALLLGYQGFAFGNPLLPAQHFMPATQFSGAGWNGLDWPAPELLLGNLLDDRFGLFAFGPLLLAALLAPWLRRRRGEAQGGLAGPEVGLALGLLAALWLFTSANQYARLQWNTGFRMLAPALPLLFAAAFTVLARLPRLVAGPFAALCVLHAWCLAMVREDAVSSVVTVWRDGLTLPWLSVLLKLGGAYAPMLARIGTRALPIVLLAALVLAIVWWPWRARQSLEIGAQGSR